MDSKTIAVLLIVLICILLFPVGIGIIGGIFGAIGTVLGALFGVVTGVFGAVFGAVGAVFGAIFGVLGWVFGHHCDWNVPFFNRDVFVAVILVIVIFAISRSKRSRPDHRGPSR